MTFPLLDRIVLGAFVGLVAAFFTINIGLRLLPAGRVFLAAHRSERRMIAHPSRASAIPVRTVFVLAWFLAIVAGVATMLVLPAPHDLRAPVPVPEPVLAESRP